MYEVNPKLGGGFELKPTSFQNLLWFVCIVLSKWQDHIVCLCANIWSKIHFLRSTSPSLSEYQQYGGRFYKLLESASMEVNHVVCNLFMKNIMTHLILVTFQWINIIVVSYKTRKYDYLRLWIDKVHLLFTLPCFDTHIDGTLHIPHKNIFSSHKGPPTGGKGVLPPTTRPQRGLGKHQGL